MTYVTEEQLLHHIKNGKALGWLVTATGKNPGELEDIALRAGYVFGSNGVGRRSSIPDDTGEHREPYEHTMPGDPPHILGLREYPETSPPPEQVQQAPAPDEFGEAIAPEIDEPALSWRRLVEIGLAAPRQATRTKATRLERCAAELIAELGQTAARAQALAEVERLKEALRQAETIAFGAPRRPGPESRTEQIRTWARSQGYNVAATGKLAAGILQAYDAANPEADAS